MYFWESNPIRGLEFAEEASLRRGATIVQPAVVGAVIDLGLCLDLTTSGGIEWLKVAYESLLDVTVRSGGRMPTNRIDTGLRNLDRAVIQHLHAIRALEGQPPVDTVKGVFLEGAPVYPGAGFCEKTHVQIAVCNIACIKGFFRVPTGTRSGL